MAIKRLTIELDDSPESDGSTAPPSSNVEREFTEPKKNELTGIPDYKYSEETDPAGDVKPHPITTGRTFPDLISEFANTPRAMATTLMFVPFIIFVASINSIDSLKYPVILGLLLNAFWFGIPVIMSVSRWVISKFS